MQAGRSPSCANRAGRQAFTRCLNPGVCAAPVRWLNATRIWRADSGAVHRVKLLFNFTTQLHFKTYLPFYYPSLFFLSQCFKGENVPPLPTSLPGMTSSIKVFRKPLVGWVAIVAPTIFLTKSCPPARLHTSLGVYAAITVFPKAPLISDQSLKDNNGGGKGLSAPRWADNTEEKHSSFWSLRLNVVNKENSSVLAVPYMTCRCDAPPLSHQKHNHHNNASIIKHTCLSCTNTLLSQKRMSIPHFGHQN